MKKALRYKNLILLSLFFGFSHMAFCQKNKATSPAPPLSMYDTLSTEEMKKTISISNSPIRDVIKIEVSTVELYYKGIRFATTSPELHEKINPKYIDSRELESDSLNSGKRVLKLHLNYRAKGKFSIKDYK